MFAVQMSSNLTYGIYHKAGIHHVHCGKTKIILHERMHAGFRFAPAELAAVESLTMLGKYTIALPSPGVGIFPYNQVQANRGSKDIIATSAISPGDVF